MRWLFEGESGQYARKQPVGGWVALTVVTVFSTSLSTAIHTCTLP